MLILRNTGYHSASYPSGWLICDFASTSARHSESAAREHSVVVSPSHHLMQTYFGALSERSLNFSTVGLKTKDEYGLSGVNAAAAVRVAHLNVFNAAGMPDLFFCFLLFLKHSI